MVSEQHNSGSFLEKRAHSSVSLSRWLCGGDGCCLPQWEKLPEFFFYRGSHWSPCWQILRSPPLWKPQGVCGCHKIIKAPGWQRLPGPLQSRPLWTTMTPAVCLILIASPFFAPSHLQICQLCQSPQQSFLYGYALVFSPLSCFRFLIRHLKPSQVYFCSWIAV